MFDRHRCVLLTALTGCALVQMCCTGCASMRKQKIVPESISSCRQMSRDGVAAMELGEWEQARQLLVKAVSTCPTDIDARRHLGEVLWQLGEHRDAAVHLETAVRLDPRHAPTLVRSGEMLLDIGAVDRALVRADEAIALDASLASSWALRGRVYQRNGDSQRALADLQQALRFAPHMTGVLLEIAEIQHAIGQPERSLTTLQYLIDLYPPGDEPQRVLWLEGLVHGVLEQHQDAAESLYAASLRETPQAQLFYDLASAQQSLQQPAAAANSLRQALALDAGHQASQLLLAQLEQSIPPSQGGVIRR